MRFSFSGKKPAIARLLPTAVPHIFSWTKQETESSVKRKCRFTAYHDKKIKSDKSCRKNLGESFQCEVECAEEVIYTTERIVENTEQVIEPTFSNMMTQTPVLHMFSVENFASDNMAMHFYTGLESYAKLAVYCLRYIYFQIDSVSVENQLFMSLMKLRHYTTNFELSRFFSLSEASVNKYCLYVHTFHVKAVERSKYLAP